MPLLQYRGEKTSNSMRSPNKVVNFGRCYKLNQSLYLYTFMTYYENFVIFLLLMTMIRNIYAVRFFPSYNEVSKHRPQDD